MSDYYAEHESGNDPFNWIRIHPSMDSEIIKNCEKFNEAGQISLKSYNGITFKEKFGIFVVPGSGFAPPT